MLNFIYTVGEDKRSLKEDLIHALDLLSIKQVLYTAWTFISNPHEVVDSNYKGEKKYVSPIKYLLIICTPLVLLLNVIDPDVEHLVIANLSNATDPKILWTHQNQAALFAAIEKFKLSEFGPISYLLLYPILALIVKISFFRIRKPFYYFLSITYYSAGIICFLDIAVIISFYFLDVYYPGYTALFAMWSGLLLVYFIGRSIGSKWFKWLQSFIAVGCYQFIFICALIFAIVEYFQEPYIFDINVGIRRFTYLHEHGDLEKYGINPSAFKTDKGIAISEINALSPIDRAGIEPGDILTEINGVNIEDGTEIWLALDSLSHKFDSVHLTINRVGRDSTYFLPVESLDSSYNRPIKSVLGIYFSQIPTQTYSSNGGVRIDSIYEDSAAEAAGLMAGDIIIKVNSDSMTSFWNSRNAFYRMKSLKKPGDSVDLVVKREGEILNIIAIPRAPAQD